MSSDRITRLKALQAAAGGKTVAARDAVALIRSGDTVATGGFVGIGFRRRRSPSRSKSAFSPAEADGSSEPRDLTLVYAAGQGDGKERGLNHLGARGAGAPRHRRPLGPGAEAAGNWPSPSEIEAYNLPQGVIIAPVSRHRRRQARAPDARRPRHLRRSAPRRRQDQRAHHRRLVALMEIDGEEYLFYKAFPIDVGDHPRHHRRSRRQHHHGARGADARGALHRDGGAQLRRHRHRAGRADRRARHAQSAPGEGPGILVDCVVVAEQPEHHMQTFAEPYSAAFAGEIARADGHARSRWR